jgi:hypothetical protein
MNRLLTRVMAQVGLGPCLAIARLGEPESEVVKICGAGAVDDQNTLHPATRTVFYGTERFIVGVGYLNGKSCVVTFSSAKTGANGQEEITETELRAILRANAGPTAWEPPSEGPQRQWRRKDGRALALYDTVGHRLMVTSSEWANRWTAIQER